MIKQEIKLPSAIQSDIDEKVKVLELEHKTKVHAITVLVGKDDFCTGYFKHPSRLLQLRATDKTLMSVTGAGEDVLHACLIPGASDPRILSEASEHDAIYLTFVMQASSLVQMHVGVLKKS